MRRNVTPRDILCRILPFFAGLPFFVNVLGTGLIGMGKARSVSYQEPGQTVPISLFIVVLFVGFLFFRSLARGAITLPRVPYVRSILGIAGAFVYINVLALLIGQMIVFDRASVLFLAQLIIPIFAMFAIMHVVRNRTQLKIALQYASIGILMGALATIAINFLNFGPELLGHYWVDNYLGIGIYQLYSYVPNVSATFTPILLGLAYISHSKAKKLMFAGGLLLTLLTIFHLPSNSALLISSFGLFTFIVGSLYLKAFRVSSLQIFSLFVIPILLLLLFSHSSLRTSFSLLFDPSSTDYEGSVEHRLDKIWTDGSTLLLSPLFGKAYRADYGLNLPGLIETRIAKPHNQFLEIGLRAGLLALVLFMLMILIPVIACVRGLRISKMKQDKIIGLSLFSSLIPSITIHNMTLVPYVQTYSGIVLYMLSGLALSYYGIMRRFTV